MPFSHHSHSGQFCGHAKDTLEEVVRRAIAQKMIVYALTEHIPRDNEDLYPEEVRSSEPIHGQRSYELALRLKPQKHLRIFLYSLTHIIMKHAV